MQAWPQIAVIGPGAVGCYFGGMLARAGAPLTLIGRPGVGADLRVRPTPAQIFIDSVNFQQRVDVTFTTDAAAVRDADVILFCVKTIDTESAARQIAPHLKPAAIVVSLQNGVDNVEKMRGAGVPAIPAVVYVAASMHGPLHVKHVGRGDLAIGDAQRAAAVARVAETFERAGVKCRISENIQADLWQKLVMNCAYNAISAIGQVRYGPMAENPAVREVMIRIVDECVAVAAAGGLQLPAEKLRDAALKLGGMMPQALASTAQDVARGKRTEIDALNGYIVRRARALGVPAPVNETLHALVKLIEERGAS